MTEKYQQPFDKLKMLKSYTNSLEHLMNIEKRLSALRKENSSKVCSLRNRKIDCISCTHPHLKRSNKNVRSKNDFIKSKCDITYHDAENHADFVQIQNNDDEFKSSLVNVIEEKDVLLQFDSSCLKKKRNLLVSTSPNKFFSTRNEIKSQKPTCSNKNCDPLLNTIDSDVSHCEENRLLSTEKEVSDPANPVEHLNNVRLNLINQNSQGEELLSTYFNIILNIRENEIVSSAKQKLSRLKVKGNNNVDQLSSLKKKQRGLLIKLQHEYNEIKFMKSFQKRLFDERKKVLFQQLRNFKTVSGIGSQGKISLNNFNFKNSGSPVKDKSKISPIKCYNISFNLKKKNDLCEKRAILRNHKKTLNDLLSLYFDLQLNATALYTINENNSNTQIIATLKEISQRTLLNNYKFNESLDFSSKRKSDSFEKRVMLRSLKKTLNNLLSLYFDLQLNASALYSINNKNSNSQIIATLKEISQRSLLNNYKIKEALNFSSKKNITSILSNSVIGNNDVHEKMLLMTSPLRHNIIPECNKEEERGEAMAVCVKDSSNVEKEKIDDSEFLDNINILSSKNKYDEFLRSKNSINLIAENSPDLSVDPSTCELSQPKNLIKKIIKQNSCEPNNYHKKEYLNIFNKEHTFSKTVHKNKKIKRVTKNLQLFPVPNLINFDNFLKSYISCGSIKNNFFHIINFQRKIISKDITDLVKKFHLFSRQFLQRKHYEFLYDIQSLNNDDSNKLSLKRNFRERNKNQTNIEIKNFSLNNLFKLVNILVNESSNITVFDNNETLLPNNVLNHFEINIKGHLNFNNVDLMCSISEKIPDRIEYNNTYNNQIWEIHDISFDFESVKTNNVTEDLVANHHYEHLKMVQIDSQNDVSKPILANSINFTVSSKSKQLDFPFKDDCYQKIIEVQSGRKVPFGKPFKDLSDVSHGNSKAQDSSIEKELSIQSLELNTHNKLLPYTTLPISTSKSLNQLEEAEELRRKQLAVEMEIKALLEQQTSQFSYFLVREIPDKPPPPYIPPENKVEFANVQVPKSEIVFRSEQVQDIVKICYENIWQPFLADSYSGDCDTCKILNDQYSSFKKANSISNFFVFDLCNELFCLKYKNIRKKSHLWEFQKRLKYSKSDVCKSTETLAMQCLGYGNNLWKDNIFINCAHKIQDHVDELLIKELQDEEAEWVNIEEYEVSIKNIVTESILNMLLTDTIQEYIEISIDK